MTDISESGIEAALLPCPFCGETGVYVQNAGWQANTFMRCPGCKSTFSISGMGSHEETVAAWNRRHPPASREEGLREAAALARELAKQPFGGGLPSDIRGAVLQCAAEIEALIPTKPEAKEPQHSEALKRGLESAVKSIRSRPPELRGNFKSESKKPE